MKIIIGIDEAGRGPLAGPVTVGAFGAKDKIGKWILKNVFENKLRDSKKLSKKKREEIYKKLLILKKEGEVVFSVSHISNKIIDREGINKAIKIGIKKSLFSLKATPSNFVRLDGLLKAPSEFKTQQTIIKGDEKDIFIACASIIAKVTRDRLMRLLGAKLPLYGFETHKGYGTLLHVEILKKYGLSEAHRKSFCSRLV